MLTWAFFGEDNYQQKPAGHNGSCPPISIFNHRLFQFSFNQGVLRSPRYKLAAVIHGSIFVNAPSSHPGAWSSHREFSHEKLHYSLHHKSFSNFETPPRTM